VIRHNDVMRRCNGDVTLRHDFALSRHNRQRCQKARKVRAREAPLQRNSTHMETRSRERYTTAKKQERQQEERKINTLTGASSRENQNEVKRSREMDEGEDCSPGLCRGRSSGRFGCPSRHAGLRRQVGGAKSPNGWILQSSRYVHLTMYDYKHCLLREHEDYFVTAHILQPTMCVSWKGNTSTLSTNMNNTHNIT
jgi:hypothetical protein